MDHVRTFGLRAFSSLQIRNYRLYFFGQAVSLCGTWMQTVALGWLVLDLTDSGSHLGIVVALQFVPLMLAGAWGGVIVDRLYTRSILFYTQSAFGILAFALSIIIFSGRIELWMLYVFALLFGMVRIFDDASRQAFVFELVGEEHLKNAISLNSTENNLARIIGPSIAGILIAGIGIPFCFFINALTYIFVLVELALMRPQEFEKAPLAKKKPGQLAEGLRYVQSTPLIFTTLLMALVVGTFMYEFQVSLPLIARITFMGDAKSYAALLSAMGLGSVLGGLFAASRETFAQRQIVRYAGMCGLSLIAAASMPTLLLTTVMMFFVGFFAINMTSMMNTLVQTESDPHMRGRVMALWTVAMIGSTPIGGPIVGFIGEHIGPRYGLALGGIACICAAAWAAHAYRAIRLSGSMRESLA